MTNFSMPVSLYMSRPVRRIAPESSLELAHELMRAHGVSALAVSAGDGGELLGVITRTDLIRVGRAQAGARRGAELLTFPNRGVAEEMTEQPCSVAPHDSVAHAAKKMLEGRVHRVFVVERGHLVGVLSTRDVMRAISDKRVALPIGELASKSVFSVECTDPIALAVERLEKAHVSGLVVVDGDWPIGLFSQVEALLSRDLPRETPTEDVLDPGMLCLDVKTPLFRAAQQAAAMDVRRILAVEQRQLRGILGGLDMARLVAG